jgi:F0F1-type ATP synthase membrane subunit b/b'
MGERDARIEGARRQAAELEAEAGRELQEYSERLRKVRGEIYAEQEAARQAALDDRARLLKAMRSRALEEVGEAKKKIADELTVASREVALQTDSLAAEIVRTILESPSPTQGARQ